MSDARPSGRLPADTVVASRYRVENVIGEGAQSVVYLARREPEGRTVALKAIHRHLSGDPQVMKRFHREAKILRQLEGEHIVKLLDFVEDDGLLVIALEHVCGTSLEALLTERAPLPLGVAIEIILQVCAALGVAHAHGVVHRDLKPANVLIEASSGDMAAAIGGARGIRVKVVDFGLGKVLHGQMSTGLTEHGMIFGTPEYMAPEQARGDEVDARADLYAAGVMLYEMAVGDVPFKARTALGTMTAHLSEAPPSPRKARPDRRITPALDAVILRSLAKEPAERFASARELAEAIASARDAPLVISPGGATSASADEIAQGDTDLHLERLGQANTLRADEIEALAASEQKASAPAPLGPSVVVRPSSRSTDVPSTQPSAGTPARKPAPLVFDEETTTTGIVPSRGGYLWVIVAVVAALVGVAIGVLVGTR